MPSHITRRELAQTAWLQGTAYATTARCANVRKHPRFWACVAWPGAFVAHCILGHRNLYLTTSRQGVINWYQTPPGGLIFRIIVLSIPPVVILVVPASVFTYIACMAYLVLLGSMIAVGGLTGRRSRAPRGTVKIAVPRRRIVIGLAAAHPDAPIGETLGLARILIHEISAGSVIVVHPRTVELRAAYERFGFRPSKGMEMVFETTG